MAGRLPAPVRELLTPAFSLLLLFQLLSGVLVSPLFALFPVYVEAQLRLPASFSGNLRALFVVLGGVMAIAGAGMVDRLGRKRAYLLAMTGVMASGGLFLTGSPVVMQVLAVFAGLMFGLGAIAGQTYLMESVPRSGLGLATACFFMTGTAGNALGSLAAGRIARGPDGYHQLGILMLAGEIVLFLLAAVVLPEVGSSDAARETGGEKSRNRELLRRPEIWALLAVRFFPTVYWGCVTFLLPLLLFRLTRTPTAAGDYTAVSQVVAAVCQVTVGRLVDGFGPRRPVLIATAALALAAVAKAVFAAEAWALVLFGLIGAGAAWSISVTMTTVIQELSTEATKARLLGITHFAWSGGFVAGTLLAGQLASVPGREGPALAIAAGCCVAAALAAVGVVRGLPKVGQPPTAEL